MPCGCCRRPRRDIDIEEIREVLPLMLEKLRAVSDFEGKDGGVFCLMEESTGRYIVEPTIIGQITNGKEDRYRELCQEKAVRLRENKGDMSSWQSRDEKNDKWGGAISDGDHIWSFSGLTEYQDEALMIMSAHMCGRIMNGAPKNYAKISDNRIILDSPGLFWKHDEADKIEPEDTEVSAE